MKLWKVRIYNNKTLCTESEMTIPDALAQMIFNNTNLGCSKDYENTKIFYSKTHTAVFDTITEEK